MGLGDRIAWTGGRGELGSGVAVEGVRLGLPALAHLDRACAWNRGRCDPATAGARAAKGADFWAAPFEPHETDVPRAWFTVSAGGFTPAS